MDRIRDLNRYQKLLLISMALMLVVFTALYAINASRLGWLYADEILVPSEDSGVLTYSGRIRGEDAVFTVSADKTVTFRHGDRNFGPYTVTEDPSAIPEGRDYMTGVEIREGGRTIFRGGVHVMGSGSDFVLLDENGEIAELTIIGTMSDGLAIDKDGNIVDPVKPTAGTILTLLNGPELTHKGSWAVWFLALIAIALNTVSILFADELFRHGLSFQIRGAERAEPSEWELCRRYISWTMMTVITLMVYLKGLQYP